MNQMKNKTEKEKEEKTQNSNETSVVGNPKTSNPIQHPILRDNHLRTSQDCKCGDVDNSVEGVFALVILFVCNHNKHQNIASKDHQFYINDIAYLTFLIIAQVVVINEVRKKHWYVITIIFVQGSCRMNLYNMQVSKANIKTIEH